MATSRIRSLLTLAWLADWSWAERLIVGAACLVPLVILVGAPERGWLAGGFALAALVLVNIVVWLHGGWRLLGPHFYYDVVRLARRGRSTILRVIYLTALMGGLALVIQTGPVTEVWRRNDFARASEQFAFALFLVQNIAVMILTPAYVASAIAEERERRTLEMLFTTHLSNTEIVLGIYFARVIHLVGFVIAGLPILMFVQFWGGIDVLLLSGNLANTILNILTVGSVCLFISTLTKTVTTAVMGSYVILVPMVSCCVCGTGGGGLILQDARTGVTHALTVQHLGGLAMAHGVVTVVCLVLAVRSVRGPAWFQMSAAPPRPARRRLRPLPATGITEHPAEVTQPVFERPAPPRTSKEPERLDALAIPYTLPPITGNALLWKERFLGGPALAFSPVVLVPMIPFLATGVLLMAAWFLRSLFLDAQDFRVALAMWFGVLRFFYYVFLACYVLGVGVRAAASIARERQQQTLEPLLLMPIDRREILWAKLVGCLWRGWPWFALVLSDVVLGTLIGAYHPVSAVLLAVAPIPLVLCVAMLGMLFSITSTTVLRANLMMVLVLIVLVSMSFCFPFGVGPLSYPEMFAFSALLPRHPGVFLLSEMLAAVAIVAVYAIGAVGCWVAACYQFERRSRQE